MANGEGFQRGVGAAFPEKRGTPVCMYKYIYKYM